MHTRKINRYPLARKSRVHITTMHLYIPGPSGNPLGIQSYRIIVP